MTHHVIEPEAACPNCEATGLFVGMAERSGAAVVCNVCKGSGKVRLRFQWDDFSGRRRRSGVRRVYQCNPGICIGEGNGSRLEDFGGLPVEAWERGEPFGPGTEDRVHTCPAWFYQSADFRRRPDWKECDLGMFSQCRHFKDKAACWRRFDAEGVAPAPGGEGEA